MDSHGGNDYRNSLRFEEKFWLGKCLRRLTSNWFKNMCSGFSIDEFITDLDIQHSQSTSVHWLLFKTCMACGMC